MSKNFSLKHFQKQAKEVNSHGRPQTFFQEGQHFLGGINTLFVQKTILKDTIFLKNIRKHTILVGQGGARALWNTGAGRANPQLLNVPPIVEDHQDRSEVTIDAALTQVISFFFFAAFL